MEGDRCRQRDRPSTLDVEDFLGKRLHGLKKERDKVDKKIEDLTPAGFVEKAKEIIACGEKGHDWRWGTDDGGYAVCQKCGGVTDERKCVWLSPYDRFSGSKQGLTLPEDVQDQVIASRGITGRG